MSVDALSGADLTGRLASDVAALERLRAQAKADPQQALRGAAQQFEALLLDMLLKSMRETTSQGTPFDSHEMRLYQSMLDQQFAQVLAARGIGVADLLTRQLSQGAATPATPAADTAPAQGTRPDPAPANPAAGPQTREFVDRLWPHALAASRETGIPAHFILGQAALESGWGRAEPRGSDGTPSHNLFGIKAGRAWNGSSVEAATTEYVNGVAQKTVERFRAYPSYADAFLDYARLLKTQPRYAGILEASDANTFARGLQQAGYATDPMYADKLARIINGNALRTALSG